MELSAVRRANSQVIMRENAIDALEFALCLGLTESQVDRLMDGQGREIGEKLARQIEQTFNKPNGWLDFDESSTSVKPLESVLPESVAETTQIKPQDFDLFG